MTDPYNVSTRAVAPAKPPEGNESQRFESSFATSPQFEAVNATPYYDVEGEIRLWNGGAPMPPELESARNQYYGSRLVAPMHMPEFLLLDGTVGTRASGEMYYIPAEQDATDRVGARTRAGMRHT